MKLNKLIRRVSSLGFLVSAIMVIGATEQAGNKGEVITEQGIQITDVKNTPEDGLSISWKTTDDRIVIGEDEFIVLIQERQIPARSGWSGWKEIGRTKDATFRDRAFYLNRDVRVKVYVDKGEVTK